jgi:hypothetical protein
MNDHGARIDALAAVASGLTPTLDQIRLASALFDELYRSLHEGRRELLRLRRETHMDDASSEATAEALAFGEEAIADCCQLKVFLLERADNLEPSAEAQQSIEALLKRARRRGRGEA